MCHLGFHMDGTLITELHHLLSDDDLQNQIAQLTCVISKLATDCADSGRQSTGKCYGETLNLLPPQCLLLLPLTVT